MVTFFLDLFDYIFEQNRPKVSVFDTNTMVARVDHFLLERTETHSLHNTIAVRVSMYVATETSKTIFTDRDM